MTWRLVWTRRALSDMKKPDSMLAAALWARQDLSGVAPPTGKAANRRRLEL